MKNNLTIDRWFIVHVGAMMLSGLIMLACLANQARAQDQEQYAAYDVAEEVLMPESIPMGFGGFDRDVLLGHELEALEELEANIVDSTDGGAPQDATARALPPTPSPGV